MGSVCRSLLNARGARVQRGPNSPITCWGLLGAGNIGNDASFETFAHWLRSNDPAVRLAIVSTAPVAAREKFGVPTRGVMTSSGPRT